MGMSHIFLFILLPLIVGVSGNRIRANPAACNDMEMKPKHNLEAGFNTNNTWQFVVDINPKIYHPTRPDSTVSVTISSSNGTKFKGFLVQARKLNSFNPIAKGVMDGPSTLSGPICGTTGNGMTHTEEFSRNFKSGISLSWSPPQDVCEALAMGDLHFQHSDGGEVIRRGTHYTSIQ